MSSRLAPLCVPKGLTAAHADLEWTVIDPLQSVVNGSWHLLRAAIPVGGRTLPILAEAAGVARWLMPIRSMRRLYSTLRTGREALVRDWPMERTSRWLERLRNLPSSTFDQMTALA